MVRIKIGKFILLTFLLLGTAIQPSFSGVLNENSKKRVEDLIERKIKKLQKGKLAADRFFGAKSIVDIILSSSKDKEVKVFVAQILKNYLDTIIQAAKSDAHYEVRAMAVLAIGYLKDRRSLKAIIASTKDKNDWVRANAVDALGEQKGSEVIEVLIEALKDSSDRVRLNAARHLGLIADRRAIEPLIRVLRDNQDSVRGKAAISLGLIGDRRAVQRLIALMKDKSPVVREKTVVALGFIKAPDIMDNIRFRYKLSRDTGLGAETFNEVIQTLRKRMQDTIGSDPDARKIVTALEKMEPAK